MFGDDEDADDQGNQTDQGQKDGRSLDGRPRMRRRIGGIFKILDRN
jgi:hypothetical protein